MSDTHAHSHSSSPPPPAPALQTGSGKTYTMTGREDPLTDSPARHQQSWGSPGDAQKPPSGDSPHGIVSRSLAHLFAKIQKAGPTLRCILRLSYLEIYNEHCYDLLNPGAPPLQARAQPATADHDVRHDGNRSRHCASVDSAATVHVIFPPLRCAGTSAGDSTSRISPSWSARRST